jgi:puromycin-sensitive aminopeptidase
MSTRRKAKAATKSAPARVGEPTKKRGAANAPDPTLQHRLPTTVVPIAYRLSIEPNLNDFTYIGALEIDIDVRKSTNEVVLNALDLEIVEASLNGIRAKKSLDKATERLTVVADEPLPKGQATLALCFEGVINDKLSGFYRSGYRSADGSKRFLATTQFEPASARRAFPCFDEPALKATFQVTIALPDDRVAISNMPVAHKDGRRVTFKSTPPMSTYLLMFAIGEFDHIEGKTKDGVAVRVYTTPGHSALGRIALETAVRGLEWFDEYYEIPYHASVPKCDLLAIPDFEAGAMENWGAITFREERIFIDPEKSSVLQRRHVAEVVLHELAHQWFGNLVSPEWWSYLWLNESFATFMAFKAMDALSPEWKVWEEYVADVTSVGMSLDSLRNSHPVEVQVADPNETIQIFDAISYKKGGSLLRMLELAIGEEPFRKGIASYLKRHQYACAASDDLWTAIGGATDTDVRSMMDAWTRKKGLPVLKAKRANRRLMLAQERFFLDRDPAKPAEDRTIWDVPVSTIDTKGKKTTHKLSGRTKEIRASSDIVKLNAAQSGFYLSHYDDAAWKDLVKAISCFPPLDRYGLQADACALMLAGYLSINTYLEVLDGFRDNDAWKERNYHVWGGLASGLRTLTDIFFDDDGDEEDERRPQRKLETFARELLRPVVKEVGWDERRDEAPSLKLLRATTLKAAMHFGEAKTVQEVRRRFEMAREDLSLVPSDLQDVVFIGAARYGGDDVLDQLVTLYEKVELPETKVRLLRASGAFRREKPLQLAIKYALDPKKVRPQDGHYVFIETPIDTRPVAWRLFKESWAIINDRYRESLMMGRIITAAAGGIPTEAHANDVEKFFGTHEAPAATQAIRQTLERIRALAKFRDNALARYTTAPFP